SITPRLPQAGEGEGLIAFEPDVVRLLSDPNFLPLIEAVRRDQASALLKCDSIRGLVRDGFAPCIDHFGGGTGVLGPTWNQPPAQFGKLLWRLVEHDGNVLGGRNVIAHRGREPWRYTDVVEFAVAFVADESIAPTHATWFIRLPEGVKQGSLLIRFEGLS